MPTGYTHKVQSGEVTDFPTFALGCARAFGALITMRDDPADKPIPQAFIAATKYYDDQIALTRSTISEISGLSEAECASKARAAHADALDCYRSRLRKRAEQRDRYEAMLVKVDAWKAPTTDHDEFKAFMHKQLSESIDFDCTDRFSKEPELQSPEEWRTSVLAEAERSLAYGLKHRQEEIDRTTTRNKWLSDLRSAL